MRIQKILLTTDFSACSRLAFPPAADLARRMEASIDLVNCMVYPSQFTPAGFLDARGSLDNLRRLHRQNLDLAAKDPVLKGILVTAHFLEGDGPETIQEFALKSGADLIVQSSHGFTGLKRFVLGSFAERLLRLSSAPILTFTYSERAEGRPPREFRPRRILFPYDYSSAAREALEPVKLLAGTYGARVLVLHAWKSSAELLPVYGAEGMAVDIGLVSDSNQIPQQLTDDLRAFGAKELAGLRHEEEVVGGDPASVILAGAATYEADLICMSTHGWTGLKRMFMGSVAEKVLRGATCPTWVVRSHPSKLNK